MCKGSATYWLPDKLLSTWGGASPVQCGRKAEELCHCQHICRRVNGLVPLGTCTACGGHFMSLCAGCGARIDAGEGASEDALCPSLLQKNMLIFGVAALLQRSLEAGWHLLPVALTDIQLLSGFIKLPRSFRSLSCCRTARGLEFLYLLAFCACFLQF